MPVRMHNSLTRQVEELGRQPGDAVGVYVCGPTVYGPPHLGHAKTAISFDVIVRWLRHAGYAVRHVQNITDVGHLVADADEGDDKVIAEARRRGLEPMQVAQHWERVYFAAMDQLGVRPPDIVPRATGHIPEQIELVQRLLTAGFAYEVNGSVYFDVARFPAYGKLSGRRIEEAETGTRVAVKDEKRHPADFALWKRAEPDHLMQWNSPWGRGFPGWHLECSAMSMRYLGESFDIHGGGMDLKFPHHEDEIAQSEAATGKPFARVWLHAGLVTINGSKMAKSQGNYITLDELFGAAEVEPARREVLRLSKPFDPLTLRFLMLQTHYRSNLDISEENLRAAEAGLRKLSETVVALRRKAEEADSASPSAAPSPAVAERIERFRADFAAAMAEDFNTPAAMAALFQFRESVAGLASETAAAADAAAADAVLRELGGGVIGVVPDEYAEQSTAALTEPLIRIAVEARATLRKPAAEIGKAAKKLPAEQAAALREAANSLFATSDGIRAQLAELGIALEDGPAGTTWKRRT